MRLAHLSDLHLTTPAGLSARDLCGKRAFGYASWALRRRAKYRAEVLELLREDLAESRPDQIVVTGDLTHLGLPAELAEAAAWLARLPAESTMVVPGNHDVYVGRDWNAERCGWERYLGGDDGRAGFPALRVRPPIALVGVSTAAPSPPFFATGAAGEGQTLRLEEMLRVAGEAGLFRVVALHHPPLAGTVSWRRRLIDAERLRNALAASGAELVLHGHAHRTVRGSLETVAGEALVLGARSSSSQSENPESRAQYQVYDVEPDPAGYRLEIEARGLDAAGVGFETVARTSCALARTIRGDARSRAGICT